MRLPVSVSRFMCLMIALAALASISPANLRAATTMKHYYAHDALTDKYGVIAPWYTGLNGQCDYRVRIAAETLRRYPWADASRAASPAPEYVWNGQWSISPEGNIKVPMLSEWSDGDRLQRNAFVIRALVEYYRYSGDASAIIGIVASAGMLVGYTQTDSSHPWPRFPISVPVKGKVYGDCNPQGMIQLDIAAEAGLALLKAYQVTGNKRYLINAKHWADLLAERCNLNPKSAPWERYANPESVQWGQNPMNGNVAYILYFLDDLIRLGYTGKDGVLIRARHAGRAYLRDKVLPQWTAADTWGRNFWDWDCRVQCEYTTNWACRYIMENRGVFPNWRNDVRNILGIFINHTGVDPGSSSEVYNGAWQFPESSGCCGRSLWYGSMELAWVFAEYGELAKSDWAMEIARRQQILATYDVSDTGVSQDNIDGGFIVCGDWFKIAHPMALIHVLETMAWLPEQLGANRENHIMRSSAVVQSVAYLDGRIEYTTYDAPANSVDVLRLSFCPRTVEADGKPLIRRAFLNSNGYRIKKLSNGDSIVRIRHDGAKSIVVTGNDPQKLADDSVIAHSGTHIDVSRVGSVRGKMICFTSPDGAMEYSFKGNQFRLIGSYGPDGGKADVYLDGVKQLDGIDCWNPIARNRQVLCYKNGLPNGPHTVKIAITGTHNPYSKGSNVYLDAIEWSAATGSAGIGEGGGPSGVQRMIFGYPGREDYVDCSGNRWKPGLEVVARLGALEDTVLKSWWSDPIKETITNTKDPELYRYGVHAKSFIVNLTVAPGRYWSRLRFCAARLQDSRGNPVTVIVNGKRMIDNMDVAGAAGGRTRALDILLNDIAPVNGAIAFEFVGGNLSGNTSSEAYIQALELGRAKGRVGATPVSVKGTIDGVR